jgi:UDP-GlcNAc:undecaprenyl-phosphate GlcNAc-1-phosphate transferase
MEPLKILAFCIGGILISLLCNILLLNFSKSLGIRNKNDVLVRWSNESKPSLGGVSFFVVFLFFSLTHLILFYEENIFHNDSFAISPFEFTGLFIAGTLAFLMGLADDAYNTKPLVKLLVQISCGIVFILTGTKIDVTHIFAIDAILTVLWVIIIMNSLNMLDNMDGITGTTVFSILLTCLLGGWIISGFNTDVWTLSIVAMLGGVLGFLFLNVHPSKLFMGDAGSQFIGLFVSFFAIRNLWNVSAETETNAWASILVTLVAFTPAAADTLTVVINRLKKGKSPMVGGKDHTTHHLVYAGLTDIQVWYVFLALGIGATLLSLSMIYLIDSGIILPIAFFSIYFLVTFYFLYRNTLKFPQKK